MTNMLGNQNTALGSFRSGFSVSGTDNTAVGGNALFNSSTAAAKTQPWALLPAVVSDHWLKQCHLYRRGVPVLLNVDNSLLCREHLQSNVQPSGNRSGLRSTITSAGRLGRGNISSRRYQDTILNRWIKSVKHCSRLSRSRFRYNKGILMPPAYR